MKLKLDRDKPAELAAYLQEKNVLAPNEEVLALEKPGEGNMNYTIRVKLPERSFIVKQSREYVEKYPSIPAPAERAVTEGRFYEFIGASSDLQPFMPKLLALDYRENILVLEDLGEASDYAYLYKPEARISKEEIDVLIQFLVFLHSQTCADGQQEQFRNRTLRALNHEHIFRYPFMEDNGFDLDTIQPGLQVMAMQYKQNAALKETVTTLGENYLADGPVLLHGDYYPGSWLNTIEGVKIIDPEFCFYGPAEFDLGVMLAHLKMATQSEDIQRYARQQYLNLRPLNENLLNKFMGVEVMRRIIGLAQLPLSLTLAQKDQLLHEAYNLLMHAE